MSAIAEPETCLSEEEVDWQVVRSSVKMLSI